MLGAEQASFDKPDEVRTFEKGKVEVINVGGAEIGRLTFEPGWRWAEHVKPRAGTDWCMAPHFQYHVSGVHHILLEDGTEFDCHPGDVVALPTPHDGWVVGEEPVVLIDWWGIIGYGK